MGTKRPEIGNKTSLTLYQEQGVTWSYKRYQDFREKIGTHLHTKSNPKSQLGDMVPFLTLLLCFEILDLQDYVLLFLL